MSARLTFTAAGALQELLHAAAAGTIASVDIHAPESPEDLWLALAGAPSGMYVAEAEAPSASGAISLLWERVQAVVGAEQRGARQTRPSEEDCR